MIEKGTMSLRRTDKDPETRPSGSHGEVFWVREILALQGEKVWSLSCGIPMGDWDCCQSYLTWHGIESSVEHGVRRYREEILKDD